MANKEQASIIGQIMQVSQHPNADRIHIAKVDIGRPDYISVVFGGDYLLTTGDLVAVALPGTRLPNGEKIRPRNYRGVRSWAELLSSDELGLTMNGPDRVHIFSPKEYRIGDAVKMIQII